MEALMLMLLKRLRKAALLCNLEITERGKGEKCKCPPAGRQQLPTWDVVLCPLTNKVTHPAPHLAQINILYLPFLTSNEKRNAGDREDIVADFMCYNVCLLPPPPQMRQCIIVSDCFHCFVFKLPAQIWVLYQM